MIDDDVRFPVDVDLGVSGSPSFSTTILMEATGREYRNQNLEELLWRWELGALRNMAEWETVFAFWCARRGPLRSFRVSNPFARRAIGQVIGTGDGIVKTFQLVRNWGDYPQTVTLPIHGETVEHLNDGEEMNVAIYFDAAPQASGWTIGTSTGIVTFSAAPSLNVVITADFWFDTPARFAMDDPRATITQRYGMRTNGDHDFAVEWPVPLIEVIP